MSKVLRARILYLMISAFVLAGALFLFFHDPNQPGQYPPCIFYWSTGLYCPGCGTTRGLFALSHGDLLRAFDHNPLMVMSLPYLIWMWWRLSRKIWFGEVKSKPPKPRPQWYIWALPVIVMVYWVLRNIPIWPLTFLAP